MRAPCIVYRVRLPAGTWAPCRLRPRRAFVSRTVSKTPASCGRSWLRQHHRSLPVSNAYLFVHQGENMSPLRAVRQSFLSTFAGAGADLTCEAVGAECSQLSEGQRVTMMRLLA